MSWSKYAEFVVFAVVLIMIPGPDFDAATQI
jgi:threonine/homoserine/homoserine lactone efflux protein